MPHEDISIIGVAKPIRRTVTLLVVKIVTLLFLVNILFAALLVVSVTGFLSAEWVSSYAAFLLIIFAAQCIFLAFFVARLVIDWMSTVYYIAGGHLIRQRGTLDTTETIFQLTDIDSVELKQSWIGRILNFGDVTVEFTIAREKEYVNLYAITNPRFYEDIFTKYV